MPGRGWRPPGLEVRGRRRPQPRRRGHNAWAAPAPPREGNASSACGIPFFFSSFLLPASLASPSGLPVRLGPVPSLRRPPASREPGFCSGSSHSPASGPRKSSFLPKNPAASLRRGTEAEGRPRDGKSLEAATSRWWLWADFGSFLPLLGWFRPAPCGIGGVPELRRRGAGPGTWKKAWGRPGSASPFRLSCGFLGFLFPFSFFSSCLRVPPGSLLLLLHVLRSLGADPRGVLGPVPVGFLEPIPAGFWGHGCGVLGLVPVGFWG